MVGSAKLDSSFHDQVRHRRSVVGGSVCGARGSIDRFGMRVWERALLERCRQRLLFRPIRSAATRDGATAAARRAGCRASLLVVLFLLVAVVVATAAAAAATAAVGVVRSSGRRAVAVGGVERFAVGRPLDALRHR